MGVLLSEFGTSWTAVAVGVVATVAIYAWVIAATRLVGLRSFSKMSAFDFAMTVAVGSIIASTAVGAAPLAHGVLAAAVLFGCQYLVARLRGDTAFARAVDNAPLLLFHRGRILDEHLARARLTRDDLRAKLREANVLRYEDVQAVVFETTGDVTVMHGAGELDPRLLDGVQLGSFDRPREG